MPKIEQSRIDTIKKAVSLLNWIETTGHEPKKQGNDYVMACVFHNDKTPSLKITPERYPDLIEQHVPMAAQEVVQTFVSQLINLGL